VARRYARTTSAQKYDTVIDPDEATSHGISLRMIGRGRRVLDVGCATGSMSQRLHEMGCQVVGVDSDADALELARRWCEHVVLADLDLEGLRNVPAEPGYDAILFADVLEHLRDPLPVLREAVGLLAPAGFVVVSVPNVAHAAVRLALLQGRWDYRRLGLLDATHLRFFTRSSLLDLLREAGLGVQALERTVAPWDATEIQLDRTSVPAEVLRTLELDREATTYQFVAKAVVADAGHALHEAVQARLDLEDAVHSTELQLARAQGELGSATEQVTGLRASMTEAMAAVAERDESLRQAEQRMAELEEALGLARKAHADVLASTSWKVTAPLRRHLGAGTAGSTG